MKILPILTAASLSLTTLAFAQSVENPPNEYSNQTMVESKVARAVISCSWGNWQPFPSSWTDISKIYIETGCSPLQVKLPDTPWSLTSVSETASYCPNGLYSGFYYAVNYDNHTASLTFDGCHHKSTHSH